MSGSTAKATRREIRRAVGVHGLDAVNGVAATLYTDVLPTTAAHAATLAQQHRDLASHDRQLAALHERVKALEADAKAVNAMTPLQRLRWAMASFF